MIEKLLSYYFEKPPQVTLMEDYEISPYELHYYLYSYAVDDETKYLVALEGGLDTNEDKDSLAVTVGRLEEHAGVTVLGWHVLNTAKATVGKEVLSNEEAGQNLDMLLLNLEPTGYNAPAFTLAEVDLDFDPKIYKSF
jgi:hypothetical protein